MRIYRIRLNVDEFQYFSPEDESIWRTERLEFDGTPKLATWDPPAVYVYKPKRPRANFIDFAAGCFCCDRVVLEKTPDFLENSGEVLPLSYRGEAFGVLNVTQCVDILDQRKTQWHEVGGVKTMIATYAFHANRLPPRCLFKIPETARAEILTVEGMDDPLDEFKPTVERLGLTGVKFEEVWSDQA